MDAMAATGVAMVKVAVAVSHAGMGLGAAMGARLAFVSVMVNAHGVVRATCLCCASILQRHGFAVCAGAMIAAIVDAMWLWIYSRV